MPEFLDLPNAPAAIRLPAHSLPPTTSWNCVVLGAGLALFALALSRLAPAAPLGLAVGTAVVALAAWRAVPLLHGGTVSIAPLVGVVAFTVLGPAPAVVVLGLGTFGGGVAAGWGPGRLAFQTALAVLAQGAVAAAWAATTLATRLAPAAAAEVAPAAAAGVAALGYWLAWSGIDSVRLGLQRGLAAGRAWQSSYQPLSGMMVALALACVPLAWAAQTSSAWALASVPPIAWLAHQALAWRARARRVDEQLGHALIEVIGQVDPVTRDHCVRVGFYAERLGRALGHTERDVERLRLGGWLHDLGKIGQDPRVLNKPAPLDATERRTLATHPVAGAGIVGCVWHLEGVASIVRHHHERLDGRGYPDHLIGPSIPTLARVVLVADALDAMTSDRPYRPGVPPVMAIREIERHAGSQFDPRVVHALRRLHDDGELPLLRGQGDYTALRVAS